MKISWKRKFLHTREISSCLYTHTYIYEIYYNSLLSLPSLGLKVRVNVCSLKEVIEEVI